MNQYLIFLLLMMKMIENSSQNNISHLHGSDNISRLYGFVPHLTNLELVNDVPEFTPYTSVKITLFGVNLKKSDFLTFSTQNATFHSNCDHLRNTESFNLTHVGLAASAIISLRPLRANETCFFFCLGESVSNSSNSPVLWFHQGSAGTVILSVKHTLLPLWLKIVFVTILFLLSGLFSGLNLGLMSLSLTDLQLFEAAGSLEERRCAHIIRPVRNHGNFLLATLLIGNVLVNSTLTIFVDELTGNGLVTVLATSIGIVVFGEIIPQAVTSRYALVIGAKTMWITKTFMVLTFLLSFPIGKLLDIMLGKELGVVYNREKLELLVREQQKMGSVVKEEMNIITGALNITTKTVREIMTPLEDAFMIPYSSVLNFDLLNQLVRNGFTRIPVYEGERDNIRAVLNIKDLTLIDCDENIPVATVCSFYKRPILIIDQSTYLREILDEFKKGRTHLAFVGECHNGTSENRIIGLVTLEDVIEEIIQAEIIDETDIITDNVQRQRRSVVKQDFGYLHDGGGQSNMSPQLKLTALQHLYAEVSSFREELISFNVLKSLLNANIFVNFSHSIQNASANVLITKGKAMKSAILLLQGRVSVSISKENLYFEVGPLMFFGETILQNINKTFPIKTLKENELLTIVEKAERSCQYTPDYSLTALSDVIYLTVSIEHYLFARLLSQRRSDRQLTFLSNILPTKEDNVVVSFQEELETFWIEHEERLSKLNEHNQKDRNNNNCVYRCDRHNEDLWQPFIDNYSDRDPLLTT